MCIRDRPHCGHGQSPDKIVDNLVSVRSTRSSRRRRKAQRVWASAGAPLLLQGGTAGHPESLRLLQCATAAPASIDHRPRLIDGTDLGGGARPGQCGLAVSYTHLRAHETPEHLVCRLLLEK